MGRSRMFDNEEPEQNQSPRTTIVGGRPPEGRGNGPAVPTGIQKLLRLAGEDDKFRAVFLEQRAGVAKAAGVELSASEKAILSAVPARQLEAMIDRVPPVTPDRRDFLRQTAASAVVLLGGAALGEAVSGCDKQQSGTPAANSTNAPHEGPFAQPPMDEEQPLRPDHKNMDTEGGMAPDEPPPRPDYNHMAPGGARPDEPDAAPPTPPKTRGISPDMPPPRPDHNDTMRTGGVAPDMPPKPDEGY
jgi:hypothetical protein